MHGTVHKRLETHVAERTDAEWETLLDRAGVDQTLYLPVSTYDDRAIDAVLAALASTTDRDRRTIEREFGRTLAPEFLSTFDAHLPGDRSLFDRLATLEPALEDVAAATDGTAVPSVTTRRESAERIGIEYETQRETVYCGMAHGILEGVVDAAETDATVTETTCVRDGADACAFRVERA